MFNRPARTLTLCGCVTAFAICALAAAATPPEPSASIAPTAVKVVAQNPGSKPSGVPVCCANLSRPFDELWVVSTRGLGCCVDTVSQPLPTWRYDLHRGWQRAAEQDLNAVVGSTTALFVHGNRIESDQAFSMAQSVYASLSRCAPPNQPLRVIVWSWPSERAGRLIADARIKAARSDRECQHLAGFVDRLDPQTPVTLIGYSFGARIVTGALHILGGGAVNGNSLLIRAHADHAPIHVVLLAAALDNDWLLPGHRHGLALGQADQFLLINNENDRVLSHYDLLYPQRNCAEALGHTGIIGWGSLQGQQAKIEQVFAGNTVGRQHDWTLYFRSGSLVARMRPYVFFETVASTAK